MANEHKRILLSSELPIDLVQRYRDGASFQTLADEFGMSCIGLREEIRSAWFLRIGGLQLEYVPSSEFGEFRVEKKILGPYPENKSKSRCVQPPVGLSAYMSNLYKVPLLSAEQERYLFRKYNYLKFCAQSLRESLDSDRPSLRAMARIDDLHDLAVEIRNKIICANLRLVVSIVRRTPDPREDGEWMSSGHISLMRAVEKFDYMRGNRFSTYATWAIKRNFTRLYKPTPTKIYNNFDEIFLDKEDTSTNLYLVELEQKRRRADIVMIIRCLSEREREIVAYRFGLGRKQQTLQQIGDLIGISKERVRQIERAALAKLQAAAVEFGLDAA